MRTVPVTASRHTASRMCVCCVSCLCLCICVPVSMCVPVCVHLQVHVCSWVCVSVCTYVCQCMCVCMCVHPKHSHGGLWLLNGVITCTGSGRVACVLSDVTRRAILPWLTSPSYAFLSCRVTVTWFCKSPFDVTCIFFLLPILPAIS